MIVSYYFDDDNGFDVQWKQHEAYSEACRTIVRGCCDHVQSAIMLLGQPWPNQWASRMESWDHRTLQGAHDLLAAAWRYKTNCGEPDLFWRQNVLFARGWPYDPIRGWLYWLQDEIASWREQPELIRAVMTILSNQNIKIGYEAEGRLATLLRQRFGSVPWRSDEGKS